MFPLVVIAVLILLVAAATYRVAEWLAASLIGTSKPTSSAKLLAGTIHRHGG